MSGFSTCRILFATIITLSVTVSPVGAQSSPPPASIESMVAALPDERLLGMWKRVQSEASWPVAATMIGLQFTMGIIVDKDNSEAVRWYRIAANEGYADAQWRLAAQYAVGEGVLQDFVLAHMWLTLAGEQDHAEAQLRLGAQYAVGQGVPQDFVLAHMWLNLASAQDLEKPHLMAGKARDVVEKEMTPEQVIEAKARARAWRLATECR